MEHSDKENKYFRAKEKVEGIKKFYTSLLAYVLVIGLLAAANYYINAFRYAWFLWAAFGWGIGLIFQGLKAFSYNPFFGKGWEERKIKEFMNGDKNTERWR
ncbi:2TM domain-containing protein [Maribacter algicola]|uniref:2TM domain-containing protein n=1 Tax=Meishania litoralis TaxID=3434685 RepID=A0ACC7LLC0_9FLAO